MVMTVTLTGRRRTEVLTLKADNLSQEGDTIYYVYRGKGAKQGKRELPQPAYRAIQVDLAAYGKDFATVHPTNPCGQPVATAVGA